MTKYSTIPAIIQTATIAGTTSNGLLSAGTATPSSGMVIPPSTPMNAGIIASAPRMGTTRCLSGLNSERPSRR